MIRITINPRKPGRAPMTFSAPNGGGYIRLESDAMHGSLGVQICHGGAFRGNTIRSDSDAETADLARQWYQDYWKVEETA